MTTDSMTTAAGRRASDADAPSGGYTWRFVRDVALEHRRDLLSANLMAVLAVVLSVPIPLLMPLLVDEVLLQRPGPLVQWMDRLFPAAWHGPVLYVVFLLLVTVGLRLGALLLGVWQTRQFTLIAKDVTYRMRRQLLARLQRVSMAESLQMSVLTLISAPAN